MLSLLEGSGSLRYNGRDDIRESALRYRVYAPQGVNEVENRMKLNVVLIALLAAAALYIVTLRRQIQAAQMRGDMYRDISARLDRRVAELTTK